jgi:hypothetical protein
MIGGSTIGGDGLRVARRSSSVAALRARPRTGANGVVSSSARAAARTSAMIDPASVVCGSGSPAMISKVSS